MLRADHELLPWQQVVETARVRRRWFEVASALMLVIITTLVTSFGSHRIASAYAFSAFSVGFVLLSLVGLERTVSASYGPEAAELSRATPFVLLVLVWIGWLGIDEQLLGTGALSAPHGFYTHALMSVLLVSGAAGVTLRRVRARVVLALLLVSLLVPAASPRVVFAPLSVVRVVMSLGFMHALRLQTDGRRVDTLDDFEQCSVDGDWDDHESVSRAAAATGMHVAVALRSSARIVAQVGWIIVAHPLTLLLAPVIVLTHCVMRRRAPPHRSVEESASIAEPAGVDLSDLEEPRYAPLPATPSELGRSALDRLRAMQAETTKFSRFAQQTI